MKKPKTHFGSVFYWIGNKNSNFDTFNHCINSSSFEDDFLIEQAFYIDFSNLEQSNS